MLDYLYESHTFYAFAMRIRRFEFTAVTHDPMPTMRESIGVIDQILFWYDIYGYEFDIYDGPLLAVIDDEDDLSPLNDNYYGWDIAYYPDAYWFLYNNRKTVFNLRALSVKREKEEKQKVRQESEPKKV
jgi:hypothetical protein